MISKELIATNIRASRPFCNRILARRNGYYLLTRMLGCSPSLTRMLGCSPSLHVSIEGLAIKRNHNNFATVVIVRPIAAFTHVND